MAGTAFNYNREMGYCPARGTQLNIVVRVLLAAAYILLLAGIAFVTDAAVRYVAEHYDVYLVGVTVLGTLLIVVRYTFWPSHEEHRHLRKLLALVAVALVLGMVVSLAFSLAARMGWLA